MTEKIRNQITIFLIAAFLLGFMVWGVIAKDEEKSLSERRKLAQFPEVSSESILKGSFMSEFEKYALDQFPLRNSFRTIKTVTSLYGLGQLDNHDIYISDGYAVKIEYPLSEDSIAYATKRFRFVYDKFLADKNVNIYCSLIPDKNYFAAEKKSYPTMDYDMFAKKLCEGMDYATYIDIMPCLDLEDYYATDTHWRQEKILPVAKKLSEAMGTPFAGAFETVKVEVPFYGVYYGQSALPLGADELYYENSPMLEQCKVTDYETGKATKVYHMDKANGDDPYEMFLAGSKSLLSIENPKAATNKELIVFRDSFGSSLAPLLTEGYSKIWLVDIRYLSPAMLGQFIKFDNQDVLFMYSTSVLNNSITIK